MQTCIKISGNIGMRPTITWSIYVRVCVLYYLY